jgi:hypothetical protein
MPTDAPPAAARPTDHRPADRRPADRRPAGRRAGAVRTGSVDWFAPAIQTGLFALHCLAFAALRLFFTTTLKQDDAVRTFEAQTLEWSYGSNDPALYTWILRAVHELVGVGLHASMLVNYALMTGAFLALLASARMVLAEPRWAAAAAWSLVLLPQVMLGHFALAHTTQVLFAAALALLAVLRLVRHGRTLDYLLLGAAVGHGFLAKYNFGLFLAAMAIAGLATAPVRARLADRRMLATGAVAILVAGPVLAVLATTWGQIDNTLTHLSRDAAGPVTVRLIGLKSAAASLVSYSWPLLIVLGLGLPGVFRRRLPPGALAPVDPLPERLIARYMAAALAVIVLSVLIAGVPKFHERHMQPLLFLVPVFAATRAARLDAGTRDWRRWAAGIGVGLAAVFALRAVELSPLCPQSCRDLVPYDRLAAHLRAEGLADGTLVTGNPVIAGNLRWYFPEARVLVGTAPQGLAAPDGGGACVAVWDAMDWGPDRQEERVVAALGLAPEEAARRTERVRTAWAWPFFTWSWPPGFAERTYEWRYIRAGAEDCP